MYNVVKWALNDRRTLFENTASKKGIDVNIVEKDFYVCLLLNYLFEKCEYKNFFAFKGGTSLSKAYNVIKRFSEDIDIILDMSVINIDINMIYEKRSNTQQDKFINEIEKRNITFLKKTLIPLMIDDLLIKYELKLKIMYDEKEDSIKVRYDNIYDNGYNKPEIKLEISPRADKVPNHKIEIVPYVSEVYKDKIVNYVTNVSTVDIERTFWEKITILHKLANWEKGKQIPRRYSRHYYDVFCMANSEIKNSAFLSKELLQRDIRFKKVMYRSNTSGYETAEIGTIQLVPKIEHIYDLENDYGLMKDMIYGEKYSWQQVMNGMEMLQDEINEL